MSENTNIQSAWWTAEFLEVSDGQRDMGLKFGDHCQPTWRPKVRTASSSGYVPWPCPTKAICQRVAEYMQEHYPPTVPLREYFATIESRWPEIKQELATHCTPW